MSWQYYGLFLDKKSRNKLLDYLRSNDCPMKVTLAVHNASQDNKVYLNHCTLLHKSQDDKDILIFCMCNLEDKFSGVVTHIGISDKAIVFRVDFPGVPYANVIPHITICTLNNGKPVDSNYISNWFELNKCIEIFAVLKRI